MSKVPKGYKQTKIGVVPEDWQTTQLKDILHLKLDSLDMLDEKEYELITVRRRFNGIDSRGIFKGKDILVKTQFYVKENDFVISKRQISHGACGLVPKELDGAIVSNEYNVFQTDKTKLYLPFLNYYVQSPKFSQTFYNYSNGVHIEKLLFKTQSWLKLKIPFPPLPEQQRIVQILTTWDNAIAKQEELIKAKEQQKKGLMQKLLSGEVRFDGFDDEWEEVKLGEIATFHKGKGLSKKLISNAGDYKCIHYGELFTKYTEKIDNIFSYINSVDKNFVYSKLNDVLMPTSDITPNGLATASCVFEENIVLGGDILIIRLNKLRLNGLFLSYYIGLYKNKIMRIVSGTTVFHLYGSDLKSLELSIPTVEEQQKIAEVLSLLDSEIELFKNELDKLKQQKKSLMQNLLTGEVRVSS